MTVVNTNVFLKLSDKNWRPKETVRLKCAGGNQYLLTGLYTDIPIKIGSVTVFQDVYVAEITDNVIIDLCKSCLKVLDCFIPFSYMRNAVNEKYCVSKVSLGKKVHIPPKTVHNVEVVLQSEPDKVTALEPQIDSKVLIPSWISNSGKPVVQVINDTDNGKTLQSNHVIGR